jgi:hypothetical protein
LWAIPAVKAISGPVVLLDTPVHRAPVDMMDRAQDIQEAKVLVDLVDLSDTQDQVVLLQDIQEVRVLVDLSDTQDQVVLLQDIQEVRVLVDLLDT